jgi:hypothetical protein
VDNKQITDGLRKSLESLKTQMDWARQEWGMTCPDCGEQLSYCPVCSHFVDKRSWFCHHKKYFLKEHRREQRFDKYHT